MTTKSYNQVIHYRQWHW